MMSGIGLLNEKPLHASLKKWYAQPEDRFEVTVDGFVIAIELGERLGIEAWSEVVPIVKTTK